MDDHEKYAVRLTDLIPIVGAAHYLNRITRNPRDVDEIKTHWPRSFTYLAGLGVYNFLVSIGADRMFDLGLENLIN
jgi:hypothetical protein